MKLEELRSMWMFQPAVLNCGETEERISGLVSEERLTEGFTDDNEGSHAELAKPSKMRSYRDDGVT